nr:MAG TPA: hypothetical protein [Caudoviricetes sp.]
MKQLYIHAFSSTRPRQFPALSFLDKAFYFALKNTRKIGCSCKIKKALNKALLL